MGYALAGGLAVAVWGAPRATKDIDLLVRPEEIQLAKEVAATCGFTLPAKPMTFHDGMELHRITKVRQGTHLTLDLMVAQGELREAWTSRVRVSTGEGSLWVVSREALIDMKAQAARPQDIYDIQRLQELDR